jgi:hypothetical protein
MGKQKEEISIKGQEGKWRNIAIGTKRLIFNCKCMKI